MGRKIPDDIRRKVLIAWLEGLPRQQIARDNQVGTGTVSEIINSIKEKESDARIDVQANCSNTDKRRLEHRYFIGINTP